MSRKKDIGLALCYNIVTQEKGKAYAYGCVTAVKEAVYDSATNALLPASSPLTVNSVYNSNGTPVSITNDTSAYSFGYDIYGNMSSVTVNGSTLVEYQFKPNNGSVDYVQYRNGDSVKYGYDYVDRVTALWYNDVEGENAPVFTYSYNAEGNLTSSIGLNRGTLNF